ncbi:hypothetical protein [Neobacillus mesonae]|uniref:hypothetical protein n=1 Tax=Neobacillus mesonae TaxID=1193713 RepID=UPI0025742C88|nr:hypothetical protein [Neobacillus mesonae]
MNHFLLIEDYYPPIGSDYPPVGSGNAPVASSYPQINSGYLPFTATTDQTAPIQKGKFLAQ